MQGQYRRTEDGQGWEPDLLLIDKRFVAVSVKDKGVSSFSPPARTPASSM